MQEFINEFIEAMRAAGCAPMHPGEIKADDKRNRFTVDGDRGKSRTGVYQLKIEDGFAVGWFRNYRQGDTITWHSKATRKFSEAEKASWAEKVRASKAAAAAREEAAAEAAAVKAQALWERAKPATGTPYTERKGIKPMGARQSGELLYVPIRRKQKLVSLQFISPDGSKRFITNGAISGGYCALAEESDNFDIIIICEGYATGLTLREATGFPVVVAFNAGNLGAVAKEIKAARRGSVLIIAADNDAWVFRPGIKPEGVVAADVPGDDPRWATWREANRLFNVGAEKAKEAAAKAGGAFVAVPAISPSDPGKRTDWNDLGVDETRAQIGALVERIKRPAEAEVDDGPSFEDGPDYEPSFNTDPGEPPERFDDLPPLESYGEESREIVQLYSEGDKSRARAVDWREKLYVTDKGKIDPGNLGNAVLFIENDQQLSSIFCYDEFSSCKTVYQCPPWEQPDKFKPRAMSDSDITHLTIHLEQRGIKQNIGTVGRLLDAVIKSRPLNPAVEYFTRLKWDGKKRLDTWLIDYCGASADDERYVRAVGRKWLCGAVKRVLEPGCKFDYMLIFEGPQGLKKSTMLEELATICGQRYFDDTIKATDLGLEKTVPKLQGRLIIEIGELSGIDKADVNEFKNQITIKIDRLTLKYHNEASEFPRKFVLAGTFNPRGAGYLDDPTGGRRFWPVLCSAMVDGKLDIEGLKKVKEQLWAEAKAAIDAGEELYLQPEIEALALGAQKDRSSEHPWESDIEGMCLGMKSISMKDIWSGLKIDDRTKRSKKAYSDISDIMVKLGYENKQVRNGSERERLWVKKPKVEEIKID